MQSRCMFRVAIGLVSILLIAAILPYWWLSINTQFRLIDDYTDWMMMNSNIPKLFWSYLSYFGEGRYRVVHDLGQIFCWRSFGTCYQLHHLFRLLVKVATFCFIYATALSVIGNIRGKSPAVTIEAKLALFVYAFALYFYFPNNPEARLAPVELSTGVAFTAFVYCISANFSNKRLRTIFLFLSFAAFLHSKEPNVVSAPLLIIWFAMAEYSGSLKTMALHLIPYCLLYAHCFLKVVFASQGGYGTSEITRESLLHNLRQIPTAVFRTDASWLIAIIMATPVLVLSAYLIHRVVAENRNPRTLAHFSLSPLVVTMALLLITNASLLLSYCMGYGFSLRYTYPLAVGVLLANIIGIAIVIALIPEGRQKVALPVQVALILIGCYYAAANYFPMAVPFMMQYAFAESENRALKGLEGIMEQEGFRGSAGILVNDEYDSKIACYFTEYLPEFFNKRLPFISINNDKVTPLPPVEYQLLRVPAKAGYQAIASYDPRLTLDPVYERSYDISKFVLQKEVPTIIDAGAGGTLSWYILQRER